MLRSYQYTEKPYIHYSMQNEQLQKKELNLVRHFVESHHIRSDLTRDCPICGCSASRYFFTKWNVDYLCCKKCGSVFAVCDEETITDYLEDEGLRKLRTSSDYQTLMSDNRKESWKEFLEWAEIRSFRFLGRNRSLDIIDVGNRLLGLTELIRSSDLCGRYELRDSICNTQYDRIKTREADIIFYNDIIKTEFEPKKRLIILRDYMKDDGLIFIGFRAGSGFDIITLKERNTRISPYEHILLPSVTGITKLLETCGFKVLEITAPGVMDVKYVMDDINQLEENEEFVKQLFTGHPVSVLQDFQRFLQKSLMSSFVRVIAKKEG